MLLTGVTGTTTSPSRRRIVVRGVVQGVGFRPHVFALARKLELAGAVWNNADGVVVEVEGDPADLDAFRRGLRDEAPPLAVVTALEEREVRRLGGTGFEILRSEHAPGRTWVSPDVTICADCLSDLRDPSNRRYRHPFVTCTNCGPRFTITTGLPYDRPTTTMAGFPMCEACAQEYADPGDRRFHAQTICCPGCGPVLSLVEANHVEHGQPSTGEQALARARWLIAAGGVVAVKGIGGFHLACDATSEAAVAELRRRKQRGDKAFAVMAGSLADAQQLAVLSAAEAALLVSRSRPIVLAARNPHTPLAPGVAPGSADVGVMLAYTPLHHLLLEPIEDDPRPRALVMTSGNLAGEPIVTDDSEALRRLAGLADAWLTHDRPIHVPCDDSVTRVVDGHEAPIRRSRGQAPLPLDLPFDCPPALAVGGDLKNTFCVAEGRLAWMSGHIGDMDDLATLDAFGTAEAQLELLTGITPTAIAADRHPAYRSRRWARDHAAGRPVESVQHHHAHVASTMAENGVAADRQVLGVAFDGTGYGDDGAAWGGEFLIADYRSFTRVAHLGYVALPGGDAGVRNPYRMALSHLRSADVPWTDSLPCVRAAADDELGLLDRQLVTGLRCVPTSSMGRLFDAVASIAGICHRVGYDAQAAMELEALARPYRSVDGYQFGADADPGPVVAQVAADVLDGCDPGLVAARFQAAVVGLVVGVARQLRDETGLSTATLSGGVFLNAFLTSACASALSAAGFVVLRHHQVPASDAGIALGQIAVLAHRTPGRRPGSPEEE
jgi:hydrogenase maturation protein HypF